MLETILTALISGGVTGVITIVSLKKDMDWVKEILAEHGTRINFLERNI